MTLIFVAELVGTALLILLGNGVVANVNLNQSGMKGGGTVQITFGWGLAVLLPVFIFASSSGAHFNPAITIAFAVEGGISWGTVPYYLAGQMLGAFLGAVLVYLLFIKQFAATEDANTKMCAFCTKPAIPHGPLNLLSEVVGTFVLVFAIKGVGNVAGVDAAGSGWLVFAVIVSVGMSLGGLTGYAINPARDLGPRLAHALLPIPGKRDSNWGYAWVPLVGPIIGGLLAVLLFHAIPWKG